MVIRLPGMPKTPDSKVGSKGPQPGPDPAWAQFQRTSAPNPGGPGQVSLQARKPDVTAYRIMGREPQIEHVTVAAPERNRHNSSVYVAYASRHRSKPAGSLSRLPVVGEIAAGQYDVTVAFQEHDCLDHEGGVVVEKALTRGGAYALRVRGTSMTHVGIEPGDVVIVRPQNWADDGDFVVANYTDSAVGGSEGLATLKRFYKRRDHIFLQSATASTDPIRLFPGRSSAAERDTVRVQGVVTMVLKANPAE